MIYYPLSTLMLAGLREILLISTPQDTARFADLLGDGKPVGNRDPIRHPAQPRRPGAGILIGRDFIGSDSSALILGDNIFYGQGFSGQLQSAAKLEARRNRIRLSG
jgi:glucose-1-phosphate thymidylyltransferase